MIKYPLNTIERLLSGNFHTYATAYDDRKGLYKELKPYIDSGEIVQDIQSAPRDARYKIHYYYSSKSTLQDTIEVSDISLSFNATCEIMEYYNLPLDFDFKNSKFGNFEILYKSSYKNLWSIKYKGEEDKLCFSGHKWNGELLVSIFNPSGVILQEFFNFDDLIYQLYNYMVKFGLITE